MEKQKCGLEEFVTALSRLLANEVVLYIKTRNAHWNVEGDDFFSAHKFFETQFEMLDDIIDDVAECIRSLGCYAPATLKEYASLTIITEQSLQRTDSGTFMTHLYVDHRQILLQLREIDRTDVDGLPISNLISDLIAKHEKMSWMIGSHLKSGIAN